MAQATAKKNQGLPSRNENGKFAERERGTQDELEVIVLLLKENAGLRFRVLDKLRRYRDDHKRRTRAEAEDKKLD